VGDLDASGYYAASIGGERLIGWHVNRGRNEVPDFFPVDRFRDRFYRSDIIHHVLVMLDETKAIAEADRLANAERQERELRKLLPPVVEIISPRDGDSFSTPNLALEYLVRSPTGEKISGIDVYLDDQKLGARGFVPVADANKDAAKLDLVLPRRNVQVTLVVRSGEKASDPRTVQLNWAGPASEPKPQPRLLALLWCQPLSAARARVELRSPGRIESRRGFEGPGRASFSQSRVESARECG
jgi:hypothetical protein